MIDTGSLAAYADTVSWRKSEEYKKALWDFMMDGDHRTDDFVLSPEYINARAAYRKRVNM